MWNVCGNDWSTCRPRVVALHPCPCLAKLTSGALSEFLEAILKKINAESSPNVCHPNVQEL